LYLPFLSINLCIFYANLAALTSPNRINLAYNIAMSAALHHTLQKITICATARLSHGLAAHRQQLLAAQNSVWQTPIICTLPQWLASFCEQAMLAGEIAPNSLPQLTLNAITEKMLWQESIEKSLQNNQLAELFDVASLADSAMEANQLLLDWQVTDAQLNAHFHSQENWQFIRWRHAFHAARAKNNALEPAWILALQAGIIKNTQLALPKTIELVGFDRITPSLQNLLNILQQKGVQIDMHQENVSSKTTQIAFDDINTECRAAVAWAQAKLAQNPNAQLAIITPVLGNIRRVLADLLDDTFHPESINPSHFEIARVYDFSIGLPLSEQLLIACGLKILRLVCGKNQMAQAEFSAILLDIGWNSTDEIDLRALIDAAMRKKCARNLSLRKLTQLVDTRAPQSQLIRHLQQLQTFQTQIKGQKQMPSNWAQQFADLLSNVNWAQTRTLSSVEHQAHATWQEMLQSLASLDALLGKISASEALHQLRNLCVNKMFLPQTKNTPNIQILGMLENSAIPLQGAWLLGCNDTHWPPPVRANPLLPITLQRELNMPNASADIQFAFAQKIQQRLLRCADEIVFSWARKDADRELRPSPILQNIAFLTENISPVATMAEKLALPQTLDLIEDNIAPAVLPAEKLRGGSQIFAAQAACPAWAFYQHRLHAVALDSPTDGLDSSARGKLVHAALQHFWNHYKNSKTLKSLSVDGLRANIHAACEAALQTLEAENLPIRIIEIERLRLQKLLQNWLAIEAVRDEFSVKHCEFKQDFLIEGMTFTMRIDRIDALENGGLLIIDYKTGGTTQSHTDWAQSRLKLPQLPLYAAFLQTDEPVSATCFAKVHVHECKLTGLAEHEILDVSAFADLKSNSVFKQFADMQNLIDFWRESLNKIALEIKTGVADVTFEKESDLLYCEVKPLLRLPERELQFEQTQKS
jgi:probable DNA repair protein